MGCDHAVKCHLSENAVCKWHPEMLYLPSHFRQRTCTCFSVNAPCESICPPVSHSCLVPHSSERFALRAGGSLLISDVTEEDVGTYTCIADNENETIEAQAELAVQGRKNG